MSQINFYNVDCIEFMKSKPDKYYELSICDPPYGIDVGNDARNGLLMKKAATKRKRYTKKDWDKKYPTEEYFKELFRVSKDQIIWGVNYYPFDFLSGGRIYWNKMTAEDYTNSDGELAYCSKINSIKSVNILWNGMLQYNMKNKEIRIHPTQKPIPLYRWLLQKYAKHGDKILDTHGGSMTNAIACDLEGFDLDICEIDKEYFDKGVEAFKIHKAQLKLF